MSAASEFPDFHSRRVLLDHVRHTMGFYHPRCIDPQGGFFHYFKDDGEVYDRHTRHLVSSTRFVFNYAMAWKTFGDPAYLEAVSHGIRFLRDRHRDPGSGGYAWILHRGHALDRTNHCYGLAFVMLAYSKALSAGMVEAGAYLQETWELMERHFWQPQYSMYADEASAEWALTPYRGQNANMHACEALLAAYEATGHQRYLDRARTLAMQFACAQAAFGGGLIWEHYHEDWTPDWEYNRNDQSNIFRPWGFQPGHQAEWAKLLLILYRHRPEEWMVRRAHSLFQDGIPPAWDATHGGLVYSLDRALAVHDADKYFWVQAEALAAAALLGRHSGDPVYWDWYGRIWRYSWQHMIDHVHGAWYRILAPDNRPYSDEKSPAGKTDYHTMGACYEVLNVLS